MTFLLRAYNIFIMTDNIPSNERVIAKGITDQEGLVGKQEGGKQDFRSQVEGAVMSHDGSNLDQKRVRRTWMEGATVKFSIGGQEVSQEEYFKNR